MGDSLSNNNRPGQVLLFNTDGTPAANAIGFVQLVNGVITPAGGFTPPVQAPISLTTTGASGPATLTNNTLNVPDYSGGTSITSGTWASRPVSPAAGQFYFATDLGTGILLVYTGSKWKPATGSGVLASVFRLGVLTATAETNLASVLIPAGLLSADGIVEVVSYWQGLAAGGQTVNPIVRYSTANGDTSGGSATSRVSLTTNSSQNSFWVNTTQIQNQNLTTSQLLSSSTAAGAITASASVTDLCDITGGSINNGTTASYVNINASCTTPADFYLDSFAVRWIEA